MCKLDKLKSMGVDVDDAMERLMGNEQLYTKLIGTLLSDESFDQLNDALKENDAKKAFNCAHTIKGITANMGFTPLYELSVKIVEPLRSFNNSGTAYNIDELTEHCDKLIELRNKFSDIWNEQ